MKIWYVEKINNLKKENESLKNKIREMDKQIRKQGWRWENIIKSIKENKHGI